MHVARDLQFPHSLLHPLWGHVQYNEKWWKGHCRLPVLCTGGPDMLIDCSVCSGKALWVIFLRTSCCFMKAASAGPLGTLILCLLMYLAFLKKKKSLLKPGYFPLFKEQICTLRKIRVIWKQSLCLRNFTAIAGKRVKAGIREGLIPVLCERFGAQDCLCAIRQLFTGSPLRGCLCSLSPCMMQMLGLLAGRNH